MPFAQKDFTDDEWIAAFAFILPPDQAREEGLAWSSLAAEGPPVSYDGDLLDLLSLVSDDCAERAWRLMGVSRDEGERRRAAFRRRIDDAVRMRDSTDSAGP